MHDTNAHPAALPQRDPAKPNNEQGLYGKFDVRRNDGSDAPGGKHHGCDYFVLDATHDPHANAALAAYADSVQATHPQLAADMRARYATTTRPAVDTPLGGGVPNGAVWLLPIATDPPQNPSLLQYAWGGSKLSTGQMAHAYNCIVSAAQQCGQIASQPPTPDAVYQWGEDGRWQDLTEADYKRVHASPGNFVRGETIIYPHMTRKLYAEQRLTPDALPSGQGVVGPSGWSFEQDGSGFIGITAPDGRSINIGFMPQESRLACEMLRDLGIALLPDDDENSGQGVGEDAARWRWVADKAWFVDAAAYAFELNARRYGQPYADADEVREAIDAAMAEEATEARHG
jgi:hypothetical protein